MAAAAACGSRTGSLEGGSDLGPLDAADDATLGSEGGVDGFIESASDTRPADVSPSDTGVDASDASVIDDDASVDDGDTGADASDANDAGDAGDANDANDAG